MSETTGEDVRVCRTCGETRPLAEFGVNRKQPGGRSTRCQMCDREYQRAWRQKNPDRFRGYIAKWRAANPEKRKEMDRRYRAQFTSSEWKAMKRAQNPQKYRACRRLGEAVREGRIHKPTRCEDCGGTFPSEQIHGHHEDYSRPLFVHWLCPACHRKRHEAKEVA